MTLTKLQYVQSTPAVLTTFAHITPKSIRIFLAVFASAAFLAPILVTIYLFTSDIKIRPGIFLSVYIFWSVGYYLLRLILWNSFGKEVITFDEESISYYCDYKYFQANKKKISTDQLQIEMMKSGEQNELGVLYFRNVNEKIEMVVPVSVIDLELVERQIRISYANPAAHVNV
jgi:hypothetical protein